MRGYRGRWRSGMVLVVFGCWACCAVASETISLARQAIEQGDGQLALARLKPQADAGSADAWYWLGRLYFYDVPGVPRDYPQAVRWFEKAARAGHADAQYKLGGMFYAGRGVRQSISRALVWWRAAAKQGQAEALNNMGALLATGTGVAREEKLGLALQILASRKGSEAAGENVARKGMPDPVKRLAEDFENDPALLEAALDRLKL